MGASTSTIQTLIEIWSDVLGRDRVGIHDNFFYCGGHSLSAMAMLARVGEAFGVQLGVRAVFESPTIEALAFDKAGLAEALSRFQAVAPTSPLAHAVVGAYLSSVRQYGASELMLREAIALDPNWAEPRVTLGLMLMQAGAEDRARVELREAARLDPFNVQAANQLKLVEELLGYEQIRTEHFVIKYRKGIDEALARDMPETLEGIYRQVTDIFGYRPERPTLIEIMPDEQYFGVRITGLPEIWTIAACSGDVIALTPPHLGVRQRGPFDWARVLRHEFTHVVTLNQTAYRVPHWFTEACAVSMEPGDRAYESCRLLAQALAADELFDLDQINWAFVRPARPQDRALAYAQADWMLEYITATFGHSAVVAMLDQFRQGATAEQAIVAAAEVDADQFISQFKVWAEGQVRQWGLAQPASPPTVGPGEAPPGAAPAADGEALSEERLQALLLDDPDNPDLLEAVANFAVANADGQEARRAVLRYGAARPVDPWVQRALVQLATATGRADEAIASIEQLDRQEQHSGDWSRQLAGAYRRSGQLDLAAEAAQRALFREPYNGSYRELAAAIALQRGDNATALHHIQALVILEPERAIHHVRLVAVYQRMGEPAKARAAAVEARKLDPQAPVAPFLDR